MSLGHALPLKYLCKCRWLFPPGSLSRSVPRFFSFFRGSISLKDKVIERGRDRDLTPASSLPTCLNGQGWARLMLAAESSVLVLFGVAGAQVLGPSFVAFSGTLGEGGTESEAEQLELKPALLQVLWVAA